MISGHHSGMESIFLWHLASGKAIYFFWWSCPTQPSLFRKFFAFDLTDDAVQIMYSIARIAKLAWKATYSVPYDWGSTTWYNHTGEYIFCWQLLFSFAIYMIAAGHWMALELRLGSPQLAKPIVNGVDKKVRASHSKWFICVCAVFQVGVDRRFAAQLMSVFAVLFWHKVFHLRWFWHTSWNSVQRNMRR